MLTGGEKASRSRRGGRLAGLTESSPWPSTVQVLPALVAVHRGLRQSLSLENFPGNRKLDW